MSNELIIQTPKWALPLLQPHRYKGLKGGRGSGKSHFFAELLIEELLIDPSLQAVCIREIQKSLKFSAKLLIENKIRSMGLSKYFEVTQTEIRRVDGTGIIIFQGMQDHTADSIKSLEGFKRAWVEEAQSLSKRSLQLLLPTIRAEGSELWFSWNPEHSTDPVDEFFRSIDNGVCIHINYDENPFLPDTLLKEVENDRKRLSDEEFQHVWEGAYNTKSDALVFAGKFEIRELQTKSEPLHGLDFGFAQDPTAGVRCYVEDDVLYIDREAGSIGLELDDTAGFLTRRIPGVQDYVIRADSARPESISYLKRKGLPKIRGVAKWSGSVEDGVQFMRSFRRIVIHPRCKEVIAEFRRYSYKVDKRTGDIQPVIDDKHNHYIDAIRYALEPLIKKKSKTLEFFTV